MIGDEPALTLGTLGLSHLDEVQEERDLFVHGTLVRRQTMLKP